MAKKQTPVTTKVRRTLTVLPETRKRIVAVKESRDMRSVDEVINFALDKAGL